MNFHSKRTKRIKIRLTLETVKHRKMYGTNLCFLGIIQSLIGFKKPEVSSERKQTFQHESLILAQDERWRRA